MELFGFSIKRKDEEEQEKKNTQPTFAPPANDDGATIVSAGGAYGTYVDLEGTAKTEAEIVTKYRSMIQQPEIQRALEDIVNEAIVTSSAEKKIVGCVTDDLKEFPESIRKRIREEFDEVLKLLDFNNTGYDTFQKWYVDGRLYYHAIVDETRVKEGIKELRNIDPRKIMKIKEVEKKIEKNIPIQKTKSEYFIYNERGFGSSNNSISGSGYMDQNKGIKIAKDSIVHVTSGILNENNSIVLSHLHKAIKPLNQLRMLEDAAVIYRISRAPERRIFYIDVGNLPKMKAEQYLRDMMTKHKNRLVYDATTGEVRNDRKFMTMLEDFWLPRREGGRGTEITTLPGGQNLGEMDDVLYFQKKLYQALNVPVSRLESENGFSLGRTSEITRDEIKFSRFIDRMRNRFSAIFNKILEKQLILKGIITPEEWPEIQASLRYDFMEDNHFEEMKESEVLQNRVNILRDMDEYVGRYYSREWVRKNVLHQSDDNIKEIDKQIKSEISDEEDDFGMDGQQPPAAQPQQPRPAPAPAPAAAPAPKPAAQANPEVKKPANTTPTSAA